MNYSTSYIARSVQIVLASLIPVSVFAQAPVITSIAPASGAIGATVTISGANFGSTATQNVVRFGAVAAPVLTAASGSLTVAVPDGATFDPLTVTADGFTAYSQSPFSITFETSDVINTNTLAPQIALDTASTPTGLNLADLDGDGKPDLIVADWGARTISVFRNISTNGSLTPGSFAPRVDFAVGDNPYFMAVGDIDGDGKPDLIVANGGDEKISIFRNLSTPGSFTTNSFAARLDLTVGPNPYLVTIRDIDGDGLPDLVVANTGSTNISVLRNLGGSGITTNTFAAPVNFPSGGIPFGIAIGDLDGDGKPDLAIANEGGTLSILQNVGSPGVINSNSFSAPVSWVIGGRPLYAAIGDLDNDGKPDIAVANYGNNFISILHNVGNAGTITTNSFSPPFNLAAASTTQSLALGDLDGDGRLDIVAASSTGVVSVFHNFADPGVLRSNSFGARVDFPAQRNTLSVVIGDLDGDGLPDVVAANDYGNTLSVFRNIIGTGSAAPAIVEQPQSATVAVGSGITLNVIASGQGTLSYQWFQPPSTLIAGATTASLTFSNLQTSQSGSYAVVVSNASGSVTSASAVLTVLAPPAISAQPGSQTVIAGSNVTFAVSATGSSLGYQWYKNTAPLPGQIGQSLVLTNVSTNATGSYYVIVSNAVGSTTSSKATLTVVSPPVIAIQPQSETVSVGGTAAFLAGVTGNGVAYQWIFDGQAIPNATASMLTISNVQTANAGSYLVVVTNLAGGATSSVAVLTVENVTVPIITSVSPLSGPVGKNVTISGANFSPKAADNVIYFGAVAADVLSATSNALSVIAPVGATYLPPTVTVNGLTAFASFPFDQTFTSSATFGADSFAAQIALVADQNPGGVQIADLDGDGKPDLILAEWGAKTVSVYRNISTNGALTVNSFAPKVEFTVGDNPYYMAVGDLNGDGKPDLVVCDSSSGTISIFENISTPGSFTSNSFAPRTVLTIGVNPYEVAIGDLDGDGLPDLVVANGNPSGTVSILRNLGGSQITTNSFSAPVQIPCGGSSTWAAIADLNNDGKPDLVVANQSGTLAILQNVSAPGVITTNSFAAPVIFPVGGRPMSAAVGDLDGDGKLDIVVANNGNSSLSVFKNVSTGGALTSSSFAPSFALAQASGSQQVFLADVDGDGRPDIIDAAGSGVVSVFRNIGTNGTLLAASFSPRFDFPVGSNPLGVAVGDLDGDGKPDIATANDFSANLSLLHNVLPAPPLPTTVLQLTNISTAASATFTLPVSMVAVGDENAAAFSISFDPAVLTFESAALGASASNAAFIPNTTQAASGQVGFELALPSGAIFSIGTQQLVQLTFQVAPITSRTTTTVSFGDQPISRGVSDTSADKLAATYLPAQVTIAAAGFEGDVSTRPTGDNVLNVFDWVQEGRFVAGLDTISNASEFQRADCAPRSTLGDGVINVDDWVQVGRYAAGLDPLTIAGGPTGPGNIEPAAGAPRGGPSPDAGQTVSFLALPQSGSASSAIVQLVAEGNENALSFSVGFDSRAVSFVSASIGNGALGAILNVNTNLAAAGQIGCAVALPPGDAFVAGTQEVILLNFASVSYSNTTSLAFVNAPVSQGLADTNANTLNATFQNGVMVVSGNPWPQIGVAPVANGLAISWPATATGFNLETSASITGPWSVVNASPVVNGGTATVTISQSTGTAFYRLHHQ